MYKNNIGGKEGLLKALDVEESVISNLYLILITSGWSEK
jgi:hypothetical protein